MRTRQYKTTEELEKKINEYFESCFSYVFNRDGEIIKDSKGNLIKKQTRPFTVCGLADALDLSRQSLLNYSKEEKYFDTITRAKRKCEVYAEERLFDKDGCNGAKFSLINNYKNWKDKQEVNTNIEEINKVKELLNKLNEEAKK